MRRWWSLAVGFVIVVLCIVAVTDAESSALLRWAPVIPLVALAVLYGTVLRRFVPREVGSDGDEPGTAVSLAAQVGMIALMGVAVAFNADMMNSMVIVLPLTWMTSRGTKQAIAMNVLATGVLGVAFAFEQGWTPAGNVAALSIAAISAAFSVALGLWITRIATWGEERQRLLTELTAAQGELETAHRDAGAAAERERLAREIHDTIAQSLTSIVMLAQRARLESGGSEAARLIEDTARDALLEARTLVASNAAVVAPAASGSLEASLTRLGERFERETSVTVSVDARLETPLPRDLEVVMLRCAQEGLANIRKHAGADTVSVSLFDEAGCVVLIVRDDGRGLRGYRLDDDAGFGLVGMRDRLALVGGRLDIVDAAMGGVCLTVRVPHAVHKTEAAP